MSDETVETIYTDDKQRRVRIEYDFDGSASDPRDSFDGELIDIVCARHDMTEHTGGAKFESQHDRLYEAGIGKAFGRYLKIFHNIDAWPVYRYEHSGVALSLRDFNDRWDSGMIGWAYINPDAETWEGMEPKEIIAGHLSELAKWMNGEVYGYIVERRITGTKIYDNDVAEPEPFEEWVEEDSCWGHIGIEWATQAARGALGLKDEAQA